MYYVIEVLVINAHVLEQNSPNHEKRSLKEFKVELAEDLMSHHSSQKCRGRPSLGGSVRRLTERHFLEEGNTMRRCRVCSSHGKQTRTKYGCKDCTNGSDIIPLCVSPCFKLYHTQQHI